MTKTLRLVALSAAITSVVAGCGLAGNTLNTPAPAGQFILAPGANFTEAEGATFYANAKATAEADIANMGYSLSAVGDTEIAVDEVTASSVRNDYFRLSYLTDGNTHSAWNPAPSDAAPSATFDLPGSYRVSSFKVKLSPAGVTMDVAVDNGDGTWTPVATGLVPSQYEELVSVDLPNAVDAEKVKITFNKTAGVQVGVCEVHWFGQPTPEATPTPAPTPVVTPTPEPSATPTVTPTICPTQTPKPVKTPKPCALVVRGLGTADGATFAFLAGQRPGHDVKGFVYVVKRGHRYTGRVDVLQQQGDTVTVSGKLCGSNESYTMVVTDDGRRHDDFSFMTGVDVNIDGGVRCGSIVFDELCEPIRDHKSTCYTKRWGKCFR